MKTSRKKLDSVALAGLHRMTLGSQSSHINNQVKSNETALFLWLRILSEVVIIARGETVREAVKDPGVAQIAGVLSRDR